jgi:predicted PurR-regulated permease PerM
MNSFAEITSATIYGQIMLSLVQGALGGLGFLIFGVSSPILWGLVMAIFAFLPVIGTAFIWVPAGLILLVNGLLSHSNSLLWRGIGLLLYGALIVSTVDNLLRPRIVGRKAHMHPVLVLLGVLGGLQAFGFLGFVIGPLILALLMTFVRIYEREKHEITR